MGEKSRLSKLLFNSSIAVVASACLVKGIVEVSGRTTSVDMPYWYVASWATLFEYHDRIYQT
ncbi:MAG: hypothetical protein ACLTYH_00355 [Streptococcus salivarius]